MKIGIKLIGKNSSVRNFKSKINILRSIRFGEISYVKIIFYVFLPLVTLKKKGQNKIIFSQQKNSIINNTYFLEIVFC